MEMKSVKMDCIQKQQQNWGVTAGVMLSAIHRPGTAILLSGIHALRQHQCVGSYAQPSKLSSLNRSLLLVISIQVIEFCQAGCKLLFLRRFHTLRKGTDFCRFKVQVLVDIPAIAPRRFCLSPRWKFKNHYHRKTLSLLGPHNSIWIENQFNTIP